MPTKCVGEHKAKKGYIQKASYINSSDIIKSHKIIITYKTQKSLYRPYSDNAPVVQDLAVWELTNCGKLGSTAQTFCHQPFVFLYYQNENVNFLKNIPF